MASLFGSVEDGLKAIGLGLLILFTLFGNSFVLVMLLRRLPGLLSKPFYFFICNICFADVLAALFTMTFEVYEELTHNWIFGEEACKAIEYIEMSLFGVNIFTHLSIALERYRCVVQPLKSRMSIKIAKILMIVSWSMPFIMSLPYLHTLRLQKQNGHSICTSHAMPWKWLEKLFLTVELLVVFLVPLLVILCLYRLIIFKLYERKKQTNTVLPRQTRTSMSTAALHGSRVSLIVASVFLICWIPFIVVYIARLCTSSERIHRTSTMYVVALYSSFVSELLTPILYCAYDRNIRPVIWNTLKCQSHCVRPHDVSKYDGTKIDSHGRMKGESFESLPPSAVIDSRY